jgi:PPP family 3-phenylpropionic acid transporter
VSPLHRLAAFYFFSYGAIGALYPLLPLVLDARGLDATEISWVMAIPPVANLFVPALWGVLADGYQARTQVLRAVSFGAALSTLLFLGVDDLTSAIVAMAAATLFRSPIPSLVDSATYAALGANRAGFARVRLWGSVGFVLCVTAVGTITGAGQSTLMISLAAAIFGCSSIVALGLSAPPVRREASVLSQAIDHIVRSKMVLLFVATALYYAAHAIFDNLFALHMKALGHESLVGWAWGLAVTAEVAMLSVARGVVASRRASDLLVFAGAVSTVRWLLTSVITSSVLLVGLQLLHAITFGLWYISLVNQVQERVPEKLRTAVQGVLYAALGLGTTIGILVGGRVFEHLGGAAMFRVAAASAFAATSIYILVGRAGRGSESRASAAAISA